MAAHMFQTVFSFDFALILLSDGRVLTGPCELTMDRSQPSGGVTESHDTGNRLRHTSELLEPECLE